MSGGVSRRRPPGLALPDRAELAVLVRSAREGSVEVSEGLQGVWWVVSRRGRARGCNEDAVGVDQSGIFGIFDGHGGRRASEFASEHLIKHFETLSHGGEDLGEALRQAFMKTDEDFYHGGGSARERYVGTTAIAAVLRDGKLLVGHVGDSRAVLSAKGHAVELSRDHVTSREDELLRVESNGGVVISNRVNGVLEVTRAIGDHPVKSCVIADPEVLEMDVREEYELLLLATDGLWKCMSNQEAIEMALRHGHDVRAAAHSLVEEAQRRGSDDDVSVLVLSLVGFHHGADINAEVTSPFPPPPMSARSNAPET
mmetsp:Transcript_86/g.241  ORF Transcript_86/g.241 Transcript_86/m.241 type:complete len:313 (-) Transcript_86:619-1557(-)|eukprot:CAMPEP_0198737956 /NCGR_PEP_ID=MMETSP1475-20131203/68132_1 /TAXON_ID= ORGANISM="Unidentified sp., Strain CCMP1999" /NCGR_SAMPLE_ID=MMETSP1475 /ASSEMBLY_ACC=CAM_ASM_001111 /LENGTH=312 /DNA_ID=CAMNT_0044501827 /DNA_START=329 /DNA_END=1267 /DNA_ORIENTATION=+